MTKRREFTPKTKYLAWERANGHCEICGIKIYPGNGPIFDHIVVAAHGGSNDPSNCSVKCRNCDRTKTRSDVSRIAKSRRVQRKHIGIKKGSARPIPGSKASGWKRKMSGEWVRR